MHQRSRPLLQAHISRSVRASRNPRGGVDLRGPLPQSTFWENAMQSTNASESWSSTSSSSSSSTSTTKKKFDPRATIANKRRMSAPGKSKLDVVQERLLSRTEMSPVEGLHFPDGGAVVGEAATGETHDSASSSPGPAHDQSSSSSCPPHDAQLDDVDARELPTDEQDATFRFENDHSFETATTSASSVADLIFDSTTKRDLRDNALRASHARIGCIERAENVNDNDSVISTRTSASAAKVRTSNDLVELQMSDEAATLLTMRPDQLGYNDEIGKANTVSQILNIVRGAENAFQKGRRHEQQDNVVVDPHAGTEKDEDFSFAVDVGGRGEGSLLGRQRGGCKGDEAPLSSGGTFMSPSAGNHDTGASSPTMSSCLVPTAPTPGSMVVSQADSAFTQLHDLNNDTTAGTSAPRDLALLSEKMALAEKQHGHTCLDAINVCTALHRIAKLSSCGAGGAGKSASAQHHQAHNQSPTSGYTRARLLAQPGFQLLISLAEGKLENFSPRGTANVLYAFTKLKYFPPFLPRLLEHAETKCVSFFEPQQLSACLYALGKAPGLYASQEGRSLRDSLMREVGGQVLTFSTPSEIVGVATGISRMGGNGTASNKNVSSSRSTTPSSKELVSATSSSADNSPGGCPKQLLTSLAARALTCLEDFDLAQLGSLTWAFAQANHGPREAAVSRGRRTENGAKVAGGALTDAVVDEDADSSTADGSHLVHNPEGTALVEAGANHHSSSNNPVGVLFEKIRARLERDIEQSTPKILVQFVYALSKAHAAEEELFRFVLAPSIRSFLLDFEVKDLCAIVWGFCHAGIVDDAFLRDVSACLENKVPHMNAHDVAALVLAFSTTQHGLASGVSRRTTWMGDDHAAGGAATTSSCNTKDKEVKILAGDRFSSASYANLMRKLASQAVVLAASFSPMQLTRVIYGLGLQNYRRQKYRVYQKLLEQTRAKKHLLYRSNVIDILEGIVNVDYYPMGDLKWLLQSAASGVDKLPPVEAISLTRVLAKIYGACAARATSSAEASSPKAHVDHDDDDRRLLLNTVIPTLADRAILSIKQASRDQWRNDAFLCAELLESCRKLSKSTSDELVDDFLLELILRKLPYSLLAATDESFFSLLSELAALPRGSRQHAMVRTVVHRRPRVLEYLTMRMDAFLGMGGTSSSTTAASGGGSPTGGVAAAGDGKKLDLRSAIALLEKLVVLGIDTRHARFLFAFVEERVSFGLGMRKMRTNAKNAAAGGSRAARDEGEASFRATSVSATEFDNLSTSELVDLAYCFCEANWNLPVARSIVRHVKKQADANAHDHQLSHDQAALVKLAWCQAVLNEEVCPKVVEKAFETLPNQNLMRMAQMAAFEAGEGLTVEDLRKKQRSLNEQNEWADDRVEEDQEEAYFHADRSEADRRAGENRAPPPLEQRRLSSVLKVREYLRSEVFSGYSPGAMAASSSRAGVSRQNKQAEKVRPKEYGYESWLSDALISLRVPHEKGFVVDNLHKVAVAFNVEDWCGREQVDAPLNFSRSRAASSSRKYRGCRSKSHNLDEDGINAGEAARRGTAQHLAHDYYCIDVLDATDLAAPSLRPSGTAVLRRRQLVELGFVVLETDLRILWKHMREKTIRSYVSGHLVPANLAEDLDAGSRAGEYKKEDPLMIEI